MSGYLGLQDAALPQAIENVEAATATVSHEGHTEEDKARDFKIYNVLLATLEGDAMDELLSLLRCYGLAWWRRTSQQDSPKTPAHCRAQLEQILNPLIDGAVAANITRWGKTSQGVGELNDREDR